MINGKQCSRHGNTDWDQWFWSENTRSIVLLQRGISSYCLCVTVRYFHNMYSTIGISHSGNRFLDITIYGHTNLETNIWTPLNYIDTIICSQDSGNRNQPFFLLIDVRTVTTVTVRYTLQLFIIQSQQHSNSEKPISSMQIPFKVGKERNAESLKLLINFVWIIKDLYNLTLFRMKFEGHHWINLSG